MRKGVLFALSAALISGVSIFINKFGIGGINPFMFSFAKNLIVGLLMLSMIILFKNIKEIKNLKAEDWIKLVLVGLIGGSVPFLLFFYGLKLTSAQNAAFIHKTMFVWVALLAMFFLKEKVSKTFVVGASLLILANVLLLTLQPISVGVGELFILIATLLWSAEIVLSKHILKELSSNVVAFGRMFFGSIFILIFLIATGNLTPINLPQVGWVSITSILLFGYVLTFYSALRLEKATVVTPILLLGSFITLALNSIYEGGITFFQVSGSVIMISGLFFILKDSFKDSSKTLSKA